MPCDDQPLCGEGNATNNDNLQAEAHDTASSSSTNGNAEITIEERRVSICASENTTSYIQTGHNEQNNCRRSRAASSRSPNLQTIALPGEELVLYIDNENNVAMETCQLFLTQYRLIIVSHKQNAMCAIPLTGVDLLEAKDIVGLQISCKDGRIIKFRAENSEMACAWYKKLMQKTCIARDLSNIFAYKFYSENMKEKMPNWLRREGKKLSAIEQLTQEFLRLKLNENNWKISNVNETFDVCPTYPQYLIVPSSINDDQLKQMSFGRYYRRFPTLVWRNRMNGAVLLRSSQPSIGFFGMSNDKDVTLYERIRTAISTDPNFKFLIVDARSYTAAWANRAKGGGFEAADTYINAEIVFMSLPNIHNIRYSFHQLRQLLNANAPDPNTYFQILQSTQWLQNIGQLFTATERCLNALCSEGTSVLVHCSDGWDRTTQIVSLCMLIADPYYRTFDGFEMLIQRQWVEFGHKFGDRGGVLNSDDNEKSPVFLQFLDCVFQLWMKNAQLFEFNRRYLMKLMQHTFSGLFGTFLFNSIKEAIKNGYDPYDSDEQKQKCHQIWAYLGKHNQEFRNANYDCGKKVKMMLDYPKSVIDLHLWTDAYRCTTEQSMINNPDDSIHQNNSTGSTHDITSDKASSTLSRSQSAASLTSLHEQNQSNYSANNCNNFMLSNGTTTSGVGSLSAKLNESCSIGSIYSGGINQAQPKLDFDGLSLIPIQMEEHLQKKVFTLEKQVGLQQQQAACKFATNATGSQNTSQQMNGYIMNGKLANGGEGIGITRRTRNESVESSFEMVPPLNGDFRLKHNSSSSLTSVCQPSSISSNGTTLSDYIANNAICCKNGTLQEGIETEPINRDGLEIMMNK